MDNLANPLFNHVFRTQASESVKLHVIYGAEYLGIPHRNLATIYAKDPSTISRWVKAYKENGTVARKIPVSRWKRYDDHHRQWILAFIQKEPLSYLQEICKKFNESFNLCISTSTVLLILHEAKYTNKVVERRAMEIKFDDVIRFTCEINAVHPLPMQLCFIDEMSTDNRAMARKRGWFLQGSRPVFKGCFRRGTRLSLLSFLGVDGLIDTCQTSGTFTRLKFYEFCKRLLDSGKIQRFPGRGSVWILDGASIHCDSNMIDYFLSRGIFVFFLPAYAPYYNPIEVIFGLMKRKCRELYSQPYSEEAVLMQVVAKFLKYNCLKIFQKCGYSPTGKFDPFIDESIFLREADLM
eukprot:Pompholyxophrys_sp_v1_NODE_23_length_3902_cov_17.111256.p2 type:complete len:351 gc:universal NODE_23_length_3902_cov_17.111256:17-1069(+)